MDKRIDDFVDPCSAEIWEEPHDDRDDGNNPTQLWTKLMADEDVSFAFESCYDSYPMKIQKFTLVTVVRQRLTHFMKIREIFKIQKFLVKLSQNLQFLVKIPNFWSKFLILDQKMSGESVKIGTPKIDTFFKF